MPVSGVTAGDTLTEAWGDSVAAAVTALEAGAYQAGGTDVAIADGGTGASTAATARTNLGLGSTASVAFNSVATPAVVFPATDAPSANVNTLDDYEEGTFTPGLEFATPGTSTFTPSSAFGFYTKIGHRVFIHGVITAVLALGTGAAGNFRMTGLPFAAAAGSGTSRIPLLLVGYAKAGYTAVMGLPTAGGTTVTFRATGSGQTAVATLAVADMPAGTITVEFSGSYLV